MRRVDKRNHFDCFAAISCLMFASVAAAEESSEPAWHKGVSAENRQRASELFQEGKKLNEQLLLGEARDKYMKALSYWEHPQLRFYLARVQKRIGLPLIAYENLKKSLDWGPEALDPEQNAEALELLRELEQKELGSITIKCSDDDVDVLLDGRGWFWSPNVGHRMLLPGEHVVTAIKKGHYMLVKPMSVVAGKAISGVVHLSVDGMQTRRRWAIWKPWGVLGAGVVIAAIGGGLRSSAEADYDETNANLSAACGKNCLPDSTDPYASGRMKNEFAVGAMVVGGLGVLGGAGMLLLNLPQPYRANDESDVRIEIAPIVSSTMAGISTRLLF